ncbi:MAG: 50S ribosomal protein L11 methyltransferase [Thermosulfidibacteraceae bacterium]|jgi:ribosomal protein L11 methyltransferase
MINIKDTILVVSPEEKLEDLEELKSKYKILWIKKGAFGSGEHETTRSCLEVMCELDFKNKNVLDIGCGTGILGIASVLLGAREVIAIDIAKEAIETTMVNIKINGVEDKLRVYPVPIEALKESGKFDIILANIYGDVIKRIVTHIDSRTVDRGFVLLSGITYDQNFEIIHSFKKLGYQLIKNLYLEEYTTVLLQKHTPY